MFDKCIKWGGEKGKAKNKVRGVMALILRKETKKMDS